MQTTKCLRHLTTIHKYWCNGEPKKGKSKKGKHFKRGICNMKYCVFGQVVSGNAKELGQKR